MSGYKGFPFELPSSVEINVRGGFPLTVNLSWNRAAPDVGFPNPWFDIVSIETQRGQDASFLGLTDDEIADEVWRVIE